MPDVADFAALFSSLQTITNLAKLLIDARDASVIRAKAIELQREIIATQQGALAAQAAQSTLLKRVSELEKEVTDLKAWDAEKQKYQLMDVRPKGAPGGSALAYALKEEAGSPEPMHLLCAHCYQEGRKSILQEETRYPGRIDVLFCQACGAEISRTGVWYSTTPRYGAKPKTPHRTR